VLRNRLLWRSGVWSVVLLLSLALLIGCVAKSVPEEAEQRLEVSSVKQAPPIFTGHKGFIPESAHQFPEVLPKYRLASERKIPGKVDQYDDYRAEHPEWYAITIPPTQVAEDFRGAVEWEPMQALLMSVSGTGYEAAWDQNIAEMTYASIHTAGVATYLMYTSEGHRNAVQAKIDAFGPTEAEAGLVKWVNLPTGSVWMIDYGPFAILNGEGEVALTDFRYYHPRVEDDALPTLLGTEIFDVSVFRMPTDFEGGNIQMDSRGTCYATQGLLWQNTQTEEELKQHMLDYLGCKQTIIVSPLEDEGTTHIDMFFKLINDNETIMGAYTEQQDPKNKILLDNNQSILEDVDFADGTKMVVHRLPMPHNGACSNNGAVACLTNADCSGNGKCNSRAVWRTYANSTFVKGPKGAVNLWPVYDGLPELQSDALAVWNDKLPGWDHRPINATSIIQYGGAMHCISRTIPLGEMNKWVADGTCAGGNCEAASSTGYSGSCDVSYGCSGPAWLCDSNNCDGEDAGCGDITFEGCCEDGFLKWCENGGVKQQNCQGESCGWDPSQNYYVCEGTGSGPEEFPIDCPGKCVPDCAGKSCGDDGCGGSCGDCESGLLCDEGGACITVAESCGDIPSEGCCDGSTLRFCGEEGLEAKQCASADLCGWNAIDNYYDCDASGEGPSEFPKLCPGSCPGGCGEGQVCDKGICMPADGGCGNIGDSNLCGYKVLFGCDAEGNLIQKQCDECCGWVEEGGYNDCLTGMDCCIPQCVDRACGSDGCGGTCGECAAGNLCDESTGLCEVDPEAISGPADDAGSEGDGQGQGGGSGSCQASPGAGSQSMPLFVLLLTGFFVFRNRRKDSYSI